MSANKYFGLKSKIYQVQLQPNAFFSYLFKGKNLTNIRK